MNSPSDGINKSTDGFVTRVMDFDSDTKHNVINAIQLIMFATIPVALIDMLTKHLFSNSNPGSKGSVELLAEMVIQLCTTILLASVASKIIYAIPTYSGADYQPLNYVNLSLGYLITGFALNHSNITDKFLVIMSRVNESWSGKKPDHVNDKKKNNVSVSKPISGTSRHPPTHQNSRADVRESGGNSMTPPIVPNGSPGPPPSFHNEESQNQNMYGGPENSIVGADFPAQEPMAANMALGGFSNW